MKGHEGNYDDEEEDNERSRRYAHKINGRNKRSKKNKTIW
jgi:hypothetical protein